MKVSKSKRPLSHLAGRRMAPLSVTCALLLGSLAADEASAQRPEFRNNGPDPVTATENRRRIPAEAYDPAAPAPYDVLFRDTGTDYTRRLRDLQVDPSVRTDSVDARIRLDLPDLNGRFGLLDRGFAPEEADLKLGPVYFDLRALSGALLFSDNIRLRDDDRDADVIGIVRLAGAVVIQLTESVRIAAAGSFVYLPFEGKAGISGFGVGGPSYSFGLESIPALEGQIAWDTSIGGWPVIFADTFRIGVGRFSYGTRDDFYLFEGGDFDEYDRAGRYAFGARGRRQRDDDFNDFDERPRDEEFVYFSNTVSASTERLLPTQTRLTARLFREDLWYERTGEDLPRFREGAVVTLRSERENLRFKPYLSYYAVHTSRQEEFNHHLRLGVTGPITDQLFLDANSGFFYNGARDNYALLWRLALHHTAGPYTRQSLIYARRVTDFQDELVQHVTYRIHQVLGPRLTGDAFASYARVEDLEDIFGDREEFRAGIRLASVAGPKTRLQWANTYALLHTDSFGEEQTWTSRFTIGYHFTDTLFGRLIYQHQRHDSDIPGRDYYENLLYVALTKYFR
jgi:hypothetical protein